MSTIYDLRVLLDARSTGMGAFKEAESNYLGMAKAALAASAVIGGAVVYAAVEAEKHIEEVGQAAYEMGEKFGLSGGDASAWIGIAQQVGVTSDQIGNGFKFLSKNMEAVNLGLQAHVATQRQVLESSEKLRLATDRYNLSVKQHGVNSTQARTALVGLQTAQDAYNKLLGDPKLPAQAAAFRTLGINIYDSTGKMMDAQNVLLRVADAFSKMQDGPEKAGLAMKLFGRSGADLIPLLNQGAAGIAELRKRGIDLGEILGDKDVEAAHRAYLAHKQFDAALEGVTNRIGLGVMPAATSFFGYMVSTGIPAIEHFGGVIISAVSPYVQRLGVDIGKAWPEVVRIAGSFSDFIPPALAVVTALRDSAVWAGDHLAPALGWVADHMTTIKPILEGVIAVWLLWNVGMAVSNGLMAARAIFQFIQGLILIQRAAGLATVAQWAWNLAMDANPIGLIIIAVAALAAGVIWAYQNVGWFHDAVNAAWDGLKAFGEWIWSWLKPVLDWLGQRIQDISGGLNAIGDFVGGGSGSGGGASRGGGRGAAIRGAASGFHGTVYQPTLFLTGEGGRPETVNITPSGQAGASADSGETNSLLREILSELRRQPTPEPGVAAALYKATGLSTLNRNRGMAGA